MMQIWIRQLKYWWTNNCQCDSHYNSINNAILNIRIYYVTLFMSLILISNYRKYCSWHINLTFFFLRLSNTHFLSTKIQCLRFYIEMIWSRIRTWISNDGRGKWTIVPRSHLGRLRNQWPSALKKWKRFGGRNAQTTQGLWDHSIIILWLVVSEKTRKKRCHETIDWFFRKNQNGLFSH